MKNTSFGSLASLLATLVLTGCATEALDDDDAIELSEAALVKGDAKVAATASSKTGTVGPLNGTFTVVKPTVDFNIAGLETQHPWVVDIGGTGGLSCRGVLIHPSWVLTAGHCIGIYAGTVSYSRTDATTGVTTTDKRSFDASGSKRGMFLHPQFKLDSGFGQPLNDIALIKLASPFVLDKNIQAVGLPRSPANPGRTGTMTTHNHGPSLPAGYTALFRSPQLSSCAAPNGFFCVNPPATSMCKGDSGSGFVELLDGRAQLVGIASNVTGGSDCIAEGGQAQFADVFSYKNWILSTIGKSQEQVAGSVRLRSAGAANAGIMSLQCLSTGGAPIEVPMNVPGGEISMDCDDARVFCQPAGSSLSAFSLRTYQPNGTSSVSAQPFTSSWTAAFADPVNNFLEYTCTVAGALATTTTTGTLATY